MDQSSNEKLQRLNSETQQSQFFGQNLNEDSMEDSLELSEDKIGDTSLQEDEIDEDDSSFEDPNAGNNLCGTFNVGINPDIGNNQLLYVTHEGFVGKAADFLEVIKVLKNLDTQKIRLTLHHKSNCADREVDVELSTLKRSTIFNTLTSKGIVLFESCVCAVSEYLIEQADGLIQNQKVSYQHEKLGWNNIQDTSKGFFASNSIDAPYPSKIRGNDDEKLGPHGDKTKYDAMIQSEVIPNPSLHVPFVLAFTAPVVPLLYGKSATPVLMVNFAGKSSQGKTTSLALMASVWGRGIVDNDRLSVIKSFSSTQNGFEAAVNSNYGVPVLFDDYEAAAQGLSFGSLIYTLAAGVSKIRCDKFGHAKTTYQWRTTIGLTGESSIFDRAGSNLGLRPRIVEFKNKSWTVSKANSINITSLVGENYGFYGEEFASKLTLKTNADLEKYYDESNAVIESKLPSKDNISDRIQTRLVLIRMTAVLVKELLGLAVDVDYITDFIVDNEKARQDSFDVYEQAKEKLVEYITSNLYRFVRTDRDFLETRLPNATIVGRIYNGRQGYVVLLMDDPFKSVLSNFNDREAILEHWRDEGFLITRTDRTGFQRKGKICSQAPACYCYTFVFDDKGGLKELLEKSETIELQSLVEDDREKYLNLGKDDHPQYTFYNGERYQLVKAKNPHAQTEVVGHLPHDYSDTTHSSPVDNSQQDSPDDNLEFDDSEIIDEIFEEKEDSNND